MDIEKLIDQLVREYSVDLALMKGKIDAMMDLLMRLEVEKQAGKGKEASEQPSGIAEQPAEAPGEASI